MTPSQRVEVEGLRELRLALRDLDRSLPRNLTKANKRVAEMVAEKARAEAQGQGGVAAKAAPSIVARASQTSASIKVGSAKFPFAMGAEFGSMAYRQFKPWRGSSAGAGYFVWPTIRSQREEIARVYDIALAEVLHDAFPK